MRDQDIEEECRALAALDEDDRQVTLKDGLIDQIAKERACTLEQAAGMVESTLRWLEGEEPERVTAMQANDGEHRLPSGGLLIVKDGHIHELRAPLRGGKFDERHTSRKVAVEEANVAAQRDFSVFSLWKQEPSYWTASWFKRGEPHS